MLTDTVIRGAKPREKPYKLYDSGGLYLLVTPAGAKLWRLKYRIAGVTPRALAAAKAAAATATAAPGPDARRSREKTLALGAYPRVSLKKARKRRDAARDQLDDGIDPAEAKRAERVRAETGASADTFGDVLEEYFELRSQRLAESTRVRDRRILDRLVTRLGHRPIAQLDTPEILAALRSIEAEGKHETAHRALGYVQRIYEFAIAVGRATRDASSGLGKALAPVAVKSHAAVTDPEDFGRLLRAIDHYVGQPATIAALKLLPLVFTRPGELRQAQWSEFDLDRKPARDGSSGPQWVIPAARMKLRAEHVVPLASQAVDLLRSLRELTGAGELVFPSLRPRRPLSENTFNLALRNLGYDGATHVSHGFRSSASTLLHELGFPPEVIETQLAHSRPGVAGIYNRSHLLPQRRLMMQAWADYLDQLKAGKNVVALRRRKGARARS